MGVGSEEGAEPWNGKRAGRGGARGWPRPESGSRDGSEGGV